MFWNTCMLGGGSKLEVAPNSKKTQWKVIGQGQWWKKPTLDHFQNSLGEIDHATENL